MLLSRAPHLDKEPRGSGRTMASKKAEKNAAPVATHNQNVSLLMNSAKGRGIYAVDFVACVATIAPDNAEPKYAPALHQVHRSMKGYAASMKSPNHRFMPAPRIASERSALESGRSQCATHRPTACSTGRSGSRSRSRDAMKMSRAIAPSALP